MSSLWAVWVCRQFRRDGDRGGRAPSPASLSASGVNGANGLSRGRLHPCQVPPEKVSAAAQIVKKFPHRRAGGLSVQQFVQDADGSVAAARHGINTGQVQVE